ncbi:MAG: RagB/SusD family nutrient uptake outer membrane protein, partial [Bacteroidia bacterium]|nr:RagB/SusD family nutrient uptake outer membrane protein [Bacteroidia bacterium]
MKNKFIKSLVVLIITLSCFSCTKLDEEVFDQVEADNFYSNFGEADVVAAMGPVYSDMRGLYAGYSAHLNGVWLYTGEETTDLQVTPSRGGAWYDGGTYYRLHQH